MGSFSFWVNMLYLILKKKLRREDYEPDTGCEP